MKIATLVVSVVIAAFMFIALIVSVYFLSVGNLPLALLWAFNVLVYGWASNTNLRTYAILAGFMKRD